MIAGLPQSHQQRQDLDVVLSRLARVHEAVELLRGPVEQGLIELALRVAQIQLFDFHMLLWQGDNRLAILVEHVLGPAKQDRIQNHLEALLGNFLAGIERVLDAPFPQPLLVPGFVPEEAEQRVDVGHGVLNGSTRHRPSPLRLEGRATFCGGRGRVLDEVRFVEDDASPCHTEQTPWRDPHKTVRLVRLAFGSEERRRSTRLRTHHRACPLVFACDHPVSRDDDIVRLQGAVISTVAVVQKHSQSMVRPL
mmetsp:Transcript_759/g.3124  ORF Transcript_759/g.3124 Transcript_759/m.3124 type:complete len:251 (+) Transcript_759:788-1540(+)